MEQGHAPGNGKGEAPQSRERQLRLEQPVPGERSGHGLGPAHDVDGQPAIGEPGEGDVEDAARRRGLKRPGDQAGNRLAQALAIAGEFDALEDIGGDHRSGGLGLIRAGGQGRGHEFAGIDLLFPEAQPPALEAHEVVKLGRKAQKSAAAVHDVAAGLVFRGLGCGG